MSKKLHVLTGTEFAILEDFKKFQGMNEKELSDKQKAYQSLMLYGLNKFDAETPADLDDEGKKEFFNWVSKNWDKAGGKIKDDTIKQEVEDAIKNGKIKDPAKA